MYIRGTHEKKRRVSPWLQEVWEWGKALAVALAVTLLIRTFAFDFVRVEGPSMQPNLYTGERLLVNRLAHWTQNYQRGDIVICRFPNRRGLFVKRLIALEGETVFVENGAVYVNGEKLEEPYILEEIWTDMKPVTVPEDCVFVMGDNRNDSTDSRAPSVGSIAVKDVRGIAMQVVYPFDRWARLEAPDYTEG